MERPLAATRKRQAHRIASLSNRRDRAARPNNAVRSIPWLAGAPGFEPGNGGIKKPQKSFDMQRLSGLMLIALRKQLQHAVVIRLIAYLEGVHEDRSTTITLDPEMI